MEGLETFHGGVCVPQQPAISKIVSDEATEVFVGQKTAKEAAERMWREMEKIMA
jgi:hypothetical protein